MAPAGADEILHRAQFLAHALPPGEGSPTYSGSTAWIAYPLALIATVARWVDGAPAWSGYWPDLEPVLRSLVHWVWCVLAAVIVLVVFHLANRDERRPADGDRGSVAGGVWASRGRWMPGAVAAAVLIAAPLLRTLVVQTSPALPASLLLLGLMARANALGRAPATVSSRPGVRVSSAGRDLPAPSGAVSAGTKDGVLLGAILAWAGFTWPVAPLFWAVAAFRRAPVARIVSGVLVAAVLGLALDPVRLLDLRDSGARLWVEWVRGGGWPLSELKGARDAAFLIAPGAIGWIVVPAALFVGVRRGFEREWGGAVWFLLTWAALALLPLVAGVRSAGVVQLSILPLAVPVAAQLVSNVFRERTFAAKVPATFRRGIAGLVLVASAILASVTSRAAMDPVTLGTHMAEQIASLVGDAPWISERALPGSVAAPGRAFILPRDSRAPSRYDFAAWTRWYAGIRYVLVSVDGPPSGRFGQHLRGQLTAQARPVAQFGEPPRFLLFHVQEGTDWTQPLAREELSGLASGPDLGPFLSSLGAFYAEAGDRQTAAVILEEALRVEPDTRALYNNLGSLYLLEGEWEAAARVIAQGLERDPNSAELLYNFGRAHFELGSVSRAEDLYRRALAQRPDLSDAHYEIARAFLAQDKPGLAVMALKKYLEMEPRSPRRESIEGVLARLETMEPAK